MSIKTNFVAAIAFIGAVFGVTGQAQALFDPTVPGLTYTGLSYTAPYGADHRNQVESAIESTLIPGSNAAYVGRLNSALDQEVTGSGSPAFANSLDGMCLDAGCTTGSWSFNPGTSNFVIAFIEIAAGGNSYLFKLDDFALFGNWNTSGLNDVGKQQKTLSHMDFYAFANPASTAVPEPGVLLLLGVGLAGLAGIQLRRRGPTSPV